MRVLVLSTWFPYPPTQGGKLRAYYLIRALAERHSVALLSFADTTVGSAERAHMEQLCARVEVVLRNPFARDRRRTLAGWLSAQPAGVVASYDPQAAAAACKIADDWHPERVVALTFVTAPYALAIDPRVPKVLDVDNHMSRFLYEEFRRAHGVSRKLRRWVSWWKFRSYEHRLLRQFDLCLAVSGRDFDAIGAVMAGSGGRAGLVPNGVDVQHNRVGLGMPQRDTLVFNGALSYAPNYEAMSHFLTQIFPLVCAEIPGVSLRITGDSCASLLPRLLGASRVVLTGFLDDVRPVVAESWASVVPLQSGAGTRLKILESMALGTPVVSTAKGVEGLAVTDGVHFLQADTPRAFADQTVRLLTQPDLRRHLAAPARELVETHYDWTDIGSGFRTLVEALESRPLASPMSVACEVTA